MQNNAVETLVGAIVVAVAAVFLFFAYTTTGAGSVSGYDLSARFASADGSISVLFRSVLDNVHRDMYLLTSHDQGRSFQAANVSKWNIGACVMSAEAFAQMKDVTLAAWETEKQIYFGKVTSGGFSPCLEAPIAMALALDLNLLNWVPLPNWAFLQHFLDLSSYRWSAVYWGIAIAENYSLIGSYWWTVLFDAGATASLVIGVNLVTDGLSGTRILRPSTAIEMRALSAVASHQRGNDDVALEFVEQALSLAEPEGYLSPFLAVGAPLRELLLRRIRAGTAHRSLAGELGEALDPQAAARAALRPRDSRPSLSPDRAVQGGDRVGDVRVGQHGQDPHEEHLPKARRHRPLARGAQSAHAASGLTAWLPRLARRHPRHRACVRTLRGAEILAVHG